MKAGSTCCALPLKAPEEEEVTAGLAAAEDMSMDAEGAGWYFYIIRTSYSMEMMFSVYSGPPWQELEHSS